MTGHTCQAIESSRTSTCRRPSVIIPRTWSMTFRKARDFLARAAPGVMPSRRAISPGFSPSASVIATAFPIVVASLRRVRLVVDERILAAAPHRAQVVEDLVPGGGVDEGREALRSAKSSAAQGQNHREQRLVDEVGGGCAVARSDHCQQVNTPAARPGQLLFGAGRTGLGSDGCQCVLLESFENSGRQISSPQVTFERVRAGFPSHASLDSST